MQPRSRAATPGALLVTLSLLALRGGMCRSGLPALYAARVGARPSRDSCTATTPTHVMMPADVAPQLALSGPDGPLPLCVPFSILMGV